MWMSMAWAITVPDTAKEAIVCHDHATLVALDLFVPTPPGAAVFLDREGRRLTTPGTPVTTPLLAEIDPSAPGCWLWAADADGLLHVSADVTHADGWTAVKSVFITAGVKPEVFEGSVATTVIPSPRTAGRPEIVARYNTTTQPGFPSCTDHRPGSSLAVIGGQIVLFCTSADPKAALANMISADPRAKQEGDVWKVGIGFAKVVSGGLLYGMTAESVQTGDNAWWPDDAAAAAPGVSVWRQAPKGLVSLTVRKDTPWFRSVITAAPDALRAHISEKMKRNLEDAPVAAPILGGVVGGPSSGGSAGGAVGGRQSGGVVGGMVVPATTSGAKYAHSSEVTVKNRVEPKYPAGSAAGEVTCKLRVVISAAGTPGAVMFDDCPEAFRAAATRAMKRWRWERPTISGKNIDVEVGYKLVFRP